MIENLLLFPLKQTNYYAKCLICNISISWMGNASANGWSEMPPWLYKSILAHKENCTGDFAMREEQQ